MTDDPKFDAYEGADVVKDGRLHDAADPTTYADPESADLYADPPVTRSNALADAEQES